MGARDFKELICWQLCEELRTLVHAATNVGPAAKDLAYRSQLRDAALDAVSDIAEGYVRFGPREFAQFLRYSLSSLAEVQARVRAGYSQEYFDARTTSDMLHLCQRATSAIKSLRRYLWTVDPKQFPSVPPRRPRRRSRKPQGETS